MEHSQLNPTSALLMIRSDQLLLGIEVLTYAIYCATKVPNNWIEFTDGDPLDFGLTLQRPSLAKIEGILDRFGIGRDSDVWCGREDFAEPHEATYPYYLRAIAPHMITADFGTAISKTFGHIVDDETGFRSFFSAIASGELTEADFTE
ncbi:hypothetical protein HY634_01475 [Candidatus Uhrbacteria bacterium]|nr:hypothetical protein [Candidatus Uhrbacteria bacterium]